MQRWMMAAVALLLSVATAPGQSCSNVCSVMDAAGTRTTGGSLVNIGACGQPGGVRVHVGGSMHEYAGFLGMFSLQPGLDTDGDGLEDEADADNDGDGLQDTVELAGTAFDPVTPSDLNAADSDGDGAGDGEEAVAGTNPRDAAHVLHLTYAVPAAPGVTLGWLARSNRTYRVWRADSLKPTPAFTTLVGTVTATDPGLGDWHVLIQTFTDTNAVSPGPRFYSIDVE